MKSEQETESFYADIIQAGRITIPEKIRLALGLKEGMTVRVTIEKVKEASS